MLGSHLAHVHSYSVGTRNYSQVDWMCFVTHKNGIHLQDLKIIYYVQLCHIPSRSSVQDPCVVLGSQLAHVHSYSVGTRNYSQVDWMCFVTHKDGIHLQALEYLLTVVTPPTGPVSVQNPRVVLVSQLAHVHSYPVGT